VTVTRYVAVAEGTCGVPEITPLVGWIESPWGRAGSIWNEVAGAREYDGTSEPGYPTRKEGEGSA
jgi:hypothetical protein